MLDQFSYREIGTEDPTLGGGGLGGLGFIAQPQKTMMVQQPTQLIRKIQRTLDSWGSLIK